LDEDEEEKSRIYKPIRQGYEELKRKLSEIDSKKYGSKLGEKSIGNELDFLALDKNGDILLIEFKHGTNISGIYQALCKSAYIMIFSVCLS